MPRSVDAIALSQTSEQTQSHFLDGWPRPGVPNTMYRVWGPIRSLAMAALRRARPASRLSVLTLPRVAEDGDAPSSSGWGALRSLCASLHAANPVVLSVSHSDPRLSSRRLGHSVRESRPYRPPSPRESRGSGPGVSFGLAPLIRAITPATMEGPFEYPQPFLKTGFISSGQT